MPAVAMTDVSNLYATVKFYRACLDAGVKPIFGVQLGVADRENDKTAGQLVLLCRNNRGFRALSHLLTEIYTQPRTAQGISVRRDRLAESGRDLIALSGGVEGDLGRCLRSGSTDEAAELVQRYQEIFDGNYFIELSRTERTGEKEYEALALELAARAETPTGRYQRGPVSEVLGFRGARDSNLHSPGTGSGRPSTPKGIFL